MQTRLGGDTIIQLTVSGIDEAFLVAIRSLAHVNDVTVQESELKIDISPAHHEKVVTSLLAEGCCSSYKPAVSSGAGTESGAPVSESDRPHVAGLRRDGHEKSIWIAWKDVKIRITDRKGFMMLILMPLILTCILGAALGSVVDGG